MSFEVQVRNVAAHPHAQHLHATAIDADALKIHVITMFKSLIANFQNEYMTDVHSLFSGNVRLDGWWGEDPSPVKLFDYLYPEVLPENLGNDPAVIQEYLFLMLEQVLRKGAEAHNKIQNPPKPRFKRLGVRTIPDGGARMSIMYNDQLYGQVDHSNIIYQHNPDGALNLFNIDHLAGLIYGGDSAELGPKNRRELLFQLLKLGSGQLVEEVRHETARQLYEPGTAHIPVIVLYDPTLPRLVEDVEDEPTRASHRDVFRDFVRRDAGIPDFVQNYQFKRFARLFVMTNKTIQWFRGTVRFEWNLSAKSANQEWVAKLIYDNGERESVNIATLRKLVNTSMLRIF